MQGILAPESSGRVGRSVSAGRGLWASNAGARCASLARGGINAIGRYRLLLYIAVYLRCKRRIEESKPKAKSITLTFRIEPGLKEALRTTADREHRSIANIIEVMIRDYCGRNSITIQEQRALLLEDECKPQSREW